MSDLDALRAANFDWAMHLSGVWSDCKSDVPELHGPIRKEFVETIQAMLGKGQAESPLGWVIVGAGGRGKTHLLGAFRREAAARRASFVLVDMTDVRNFWDTVLQGYIDSLQQSFEGELFQYECVLRNIIEPNDPAAEILSDIAGHKSTDLKRDIDKLLAVLRLVHREAQRYSDVVRALVCLNSNDYSVSNMGMTWLQGQAIEEPDKKSFGFRVTQEQPRKIIEALSWFMSLAGPTVLAFDHLEPIVTQLHYRQQAETSSEEQATAQAITVEIGAGLGILRDITKNTLTVVSCVETTWEILSKTAIKNYLDRFEDLRQLLAAGDAVIAPVMV